MTRKEEIEEASYEYCNPLYSPQPTGNLAFRRGAEWADDTMIEKLGRFIKKHKNSVVITDADKFIKEFKQFE